MANSAGYHESESRLRPETMDNHRALTSMQEELEAADWYDQRVDAATDQGLKDILAHNRDEEYLFTAGSLVAIEQAAAGGGEGETAVEGGSSLGIGSLRGGQSL